MKIEALTLQEAVDNSNDQGQYPDFFPVNIGDDFKLKSRPELSVTIPSPRRVRIRIESYQGICAGAVHYYASIEADGIIRHEEDPNTKQRLSVSGYLGEEFKSLPRMTRDLWGGNYRIEATRPVTPEDKAQEPLRWVQYIPYEHNTNAFHTAEEAEAMARAIVSARFAEEWEVIVENPFTKTK